MSRNLITRASTTIHASKSKTWKALINPEAIQQYMFGTHVESDWQQGSAIVWKGEWQGKMYEDRGKILQILPEQILQYSHFSPLSNLPDKPENYHTVTIVLTADGGNTFVTLTQDHNANEKEKADSAKNWKMMLTSLKEYLEK